MTFATRQRILLGLAVLMMLAPTFMYAGGYLGRAPMFEGDQRQEMTCLACDGMGKVKEEPCKTCYGRGVAEYILPGPNRPLQLVGTVYDVKSRPLVGAEIEITPSENPGAPIVMRTNHDGQFGFKFPPGSYKLKLKHEKLAAEQSLTVEANTKPIAASGSETLHKIERTFTLQ
jgi:hypothetical protein